LALFPGDFSLEAALTILPDMTMLDLATLLDKSLLHGVPQGRYAMHELLRQFVQQQSVPPPQTFQAAYSRYYLALVAQNEKSLRGRDPQPALTLMQNELEHLRQAWLWAVEQQMVEGLDAAATGLSRFYHLAGLFHEAEHRFLTTLTAVQMWATSPTTSRL